MNTQAEADFGFQNEGIPYHPMSGLRIHPLGSPDPRMPQSPRLASPFSQIPTTIGAFGKPSAFRGAGGVPKLDQLATAAQEHEVKHNSPLLSSYYTEEEDEEEFSSSPRINALYNSNHHLKPDHHDYQGSSHSIIIVDSDEDSPLPREIKRPSIGTKPEGDFDQIKYENIRFGPAIGEGSFGEVYAATLWSQPVAVKVMRMGSSEADKRYRKYLKEVSIMRSLRHPNIVEFMGISLVTQDPMKNSPATLCIVTELMPNGNLEDLLEKRNISWKRFFRFAKDIASGLNWLHHKGIIHRDLKPSNLLLTANYHVKIADFGLSHMRNTPSDESAFYSMCGTRCYIAPEVMQKNPYNHKADVFSFGVVLCEMIDGRYPFDTIDSRETSSFNDAIISGIRPRVPEKCPLELRHLIELCWLEKSQDRPSMDEVLEILTKIEGPILKATHSLLDEDLDELPEEVKKAIHEERLRLTEAQSELSAERTRSFALTSRIHKLQKKLDEEVMERKKSQQRLRKLYKERQKWVEEKESTGPPQTRSKSSSDSKKSRKRKQSSESSQFSKKSLHSRTKPITDQIVELKSIRTRSRSKAEANSDRKLSLRSSAQSQTSLPD